MDAKAKLVLLLFFASLYSSLASGSEGKFVNLNLFMLYGNDSESIGPCCCCFLSKKMLALPKPPVCSATIAA